MENTLRILIAEDEAIIALLLADVVESLGHVVCGVVATEAEAVSAALMESPDLMIVDARLGEGSGIDAVEAILKSRFVPHMFVTGNISGVHERFPDAITLEKPFFIRELELAIRQAVAQPIPLRAVPHRGTIRLAPLVARGGTT